MGKKIFSGLCAFMAAGTLFISAGFLSFAQSGYRNVDTTLKVYDYADLFTDSEEGTLAEQCQGIIDTYGFDVFVVAIDDNDVSYESENRTMSFLEDFGDSNGFGMGSEQNYAAFIIDMDERNYSVDIKGDTCFTIFTDNRQESILDAAESSMQSGSYYSAASRALSKIEDFALDGPTAEAVGTEAELRGRWIAQAAFISFASALVMGIIIAGIILLVQFGKHRTIKKAVNADYYEAENSFKITYSNKKHLGVFKTYRKIDTGSSGGAGSSRGVTTTRSSSSGSSHSGSSRGF